MYKVNTKGIVLPFLRQLLYFSQKYSKQKAHPKFGHFTDLFLLPPFFQLLAGVVMAAAVATGRNVCSGMFADRNVNGSDSSGVSQQKVMAGRRKGQILHQRGQTFSEIRMYNRHKNLRIKALR